MLMNQNMVSMPGFCFNKNILTEFLSPEIPSSGDATFCKACGDVVRHWGQVSPFHVYVHNYPYLRHTMSDGSVWDIPVFIIALDRARYFAHEFDNDLFRSLKEDTWPLFDDSDGDIIDWAANNMNWKDVEPFAIKIQEPDCGDYTEDWFNGYNVEIIRNE